MHFIHVVFCEALELAAHVRTYMAKCFLHWMDGADRIGRMGEKEQETSTAVYYCITATLPVRIMLSIRLRNITCNLT
jgi:hypothetical protein